MLRAMSEDDVKHRVARRIASEKSPLPVTGAGRHAALLAGIAQASVRSVGRTVRRTVGRDVPDFEAEAELAASLGRLKGTVTKMGQLLGYVDVGLPETLRSALSALHTTAQPTDAARIRAVLEEDLGERGRELVRTMSPAPLSVGSIGQVHRATLPDGTAVVVKVLHPGVSTAIERDFAPAMVASRFSSSIHTVIAQVRARFLEECDYALEARRQATFRRVLTGHPTVVVPAVHAAYCSPRVLTSTWIDGVHLDAWLAGDPSDEARNRAGEALFDAYIAPLFRHGLYDCDPHPGNYLFMPDGRVAVVDFGCAREFEPGFVERLAALTRAVMADDTDRIHHALVGFGLDERTTYDRPATRALLRAFYGPLVRDEELAFDLRAEIIELREVLSSAWRARRLAVSGELFFLLRTFVGLSSVLARIGARARWGRRLEVVLASPVVEPPASEPAPAAANDRHDRVVAPPSAAHQSPRPSVPRPEAKKQSTNVAAAPIAPPAEAERPQADHASRSKTTPPAIEVSWDLVLVEAGDSPIALMRELRELMGADLRELKDLIDTTPRTLKRGLERAEAESLRHRLERVGACVEVRCASPPA